MSKQALTITERAAIEIKKLLAKQEENACAIRVCVISGGCSGYKYFLEYATSKNKYDEIIKDRDITIFIDPKALMYVLGSKMDFVDETFKSGFIFINPNEKSKCGCGKSFSV
mgnify:CR=1 FL=1